MLLIRSFKTLQFSVCFFIGIYTSQAFSAACCGGGFAIPAIITSDDRAQLTTSYTYSKIDSDVNANGVWRKHGSNESTQILKIDGSHIFSDRYQSGFSLPIQMRKKVGSQGSESTGIGDTALTLGYEYLPDWDYNPWRPHGVSFLSLTLPTGKSVYELNDPTGLESRGRGFWALGIGTILTKSWLQWDANSSIELHHSFEKSIHSTQLTGTAKPGNGGSFTLGSGYNIKKLRIGAAISWNYEDPITMKGSISSTGSVQRFSSGILTASYMLPENWASTLSYSDQLLFGSPINSPLSKSVSILFQKRWLR